MLEELTHAWTIPLWREGRVAAEAAALRRDPVLRGVGVPRGLDRPVLLVPGFLAGDPSLAMMTTWLRRVGYRTSRAGIRLNVDCASAAVDRLEARLEAMAERYGQRVAMVGQSRGGTFARALAVKRPDLASGIVCLGSPQLDALAIHPLVRLQIRALSRLGDFGVPGLFAPSCLDGDCCRELRGGTERPFPREVGFVAIYSRSDGIVDWRSCLDPDAEHVEVDSSHCGMAVNAAVYRAIGPALRSFAGVESAAGAVA